MSYTYFLNFVYAGWTKIVHFFLIPIFFISFCVASFFQNSEYIFVFFMVLFILFSAFIPFYKMSPFTLKEILFPVPKQMFFNFNFIKNMTLEEQIKHSEQFINFIDLSYRKKSEQHNVRLKYFQFLINTYSYDSIFIFKRKPIVTKLKVHHYNKYAYYEDFFDCLLLNIQDNKTSNLTIETLTEIISSEKVFDDYYLNILIDKEDKIINDNILQLCQKYHPKLSIKAEELLLKKSLEKF